ncbi:MAG TPA: S9 family peptidase [Gemmatimonadaceae bacterium]|nr:S9 family peptidase [Gemmatimonadaceae bacterium]
MTHVLPGTARNLQAALATLLFATTAHTQQPTKRAFQLADWYRLATLSAPAMSPDGQRIAFTVQTVNEKENKYHREVWVVPVAGGAPQRFTSPNTESSNPRWSPDGRYLLFTSQRSGGKGSTWMLRMDQPGGEAFQNENFPRGTSFPASAAFAVWSDADTASADSSKKSDDPFAKMPPMARPPYGAITRPVDPSRFDGRHIYDIRYKSNDQGFLPGAREARRWHPAQIWMQSFDGSPKRKLTDTPYSHRGVAVSPDGQWVAFIADAELRPDSVVELRNDSIAQLPYDRRRDDVDRNNVDVYVMPIAGGTPRKVASFFGDESDLVWSPDSKRLAFIAAPGRMKSDRVWTVAATGGTPDNALGDWKYEPNTIHWDTDGNITMVAATGGSSGVFRLNPSSHKLTQLLGGRRRINSASSDARASKIAFVATDLTHPTELFVANSDGSGERRLTSFNDRLNAEVAWSDAERFTYTSVGGLEIEGWLMKPYGYEAGKKYPLALYIHGGPHSAYGENWFDEFQNLAAAGMFVLFTNPRGSSGYGADFTYSTRGRWGAEDYEDLMKAVDIAARRPDVDSTRMGVTGGSYGGFMTAWVTTKTNRFKAAEADRMISDWTYWYGASDAQGLTEFEFFGKPWDNFAMYDSLSPIRHVTNVKTPTLIVQSEDDFRTPMGNAELWFAALKREGVPVELVRYPRSTHELSRSGEPWLLVDRLGRIRQWFTYWLIDKNYASR